MVTTRQKIAVGLRRLSKLKILDALKDKYGDMTMSHNDWARFLGHQVLCALGLVCMVLNGHCPRLNGQAGNLQ